MEAFADAVSDGMIAVEVQVVLINHINKACFGLEYGELLDQVNEFLEQSNIFPASDPSSPKQNQAELSVEIRPQPSDNSQLQSPAEVAEEKLERPINK